MEGSIQGGSTGGAGGIPGRGIGMAPAKPSLSPKLNAAWREFQANEKAINRRSAEVLAKSSRDLKRESKREALEKAGQGQGKGVTPPELRYDSRSSLPRPTIRPASKHLDWRKDTAAFLTRYAHVPMDAAVGVQVGRRIYGKDGIADPLTGVQFEELSQTTSHRTRELRGQTLFRLMKTLRDAGFQLGSPWNLTSRHIRQVMQGFKERYDAGTLASSSIAQDMLVLHWWSRMAGYDKAYEDARSEMDPMMWTRQLMAGEDKSWEGAKVNIAKKIDEAWDMEHFVAMALLAQHAFGLRRLESLMLNPHVAFIPGGVHGHGYLRIEAGAKGGRVRTFEIMTQWQADVLKVLQDYCKRTNWATIGDGDRTLKQSIERYNYVLKVLGITKREAGVVGHGLRAGFACRLLESFGVVPPVWGGQGKSEDAQLDEAAYKHVTNSLGHSRKSVVGAYVGTPASVARAEKEKLAKILDANQTKAGEGLSGAGLPGEGSAGVAPGGQVEDGGNQ